MSNSLTAGEKHGRLTLTSRVPGRGRARWHVACECGQQKVVLESNIRGGNTTSCGCYHSERMREVATKHGGCANYTVTPEYEAWRTMIARCYSETAHSYPYYGGKGVRVAQEWIDSYEAFRDAVGPRPSTGHVLSRVDNEGHFVPGNTAWVTRSQSDRNKRNNKYYEVNNRSMCLEDWAREYGIAKSTLHYRLAKGLTMREALDVGHGRRGKALPL